MAVVYIVGGSYLVMSGRVSPIDPESAWARSGAQWLTSPGAGVPIGMVERLLELLESLNDRKAGLVGLVAADGLGLLAERAAASCFGPSSNLSCGGATRLLPADDRWLAMTIARSSDRDALPALFEATPRELGLDGERVEWDRLAHRTQKVSAQSVVERSEMLGLACSVVGEEVDPEPAKLERVGSIAPGPLQGLVVANLGALWAAPLAADVLARLGSRVLTIESVRRPDGARMARGFFEALHGRTESVALELDRESGQVELQRLLMAMDVVIEASRPRALHQMGIDGRTMARSGPRIWVSLTGHGQAKPNRVGFGDDAAAAGGLVAGPTEAPVFLADAIADPLAGLTIAANVAELAESGGRWHVDVALSRVARSFVDGRWSPARYAAARPRMRIDPGAPLELGRDTQRILREFGVRP